MGKFFAHDSEMEERDEAYHPHQHSKLRVF